MMNLAEIECSAGLFDSRYATLGRRTVLTMTANAYEIAFFEGEERSAWVNDKVVTIGAGRVLCLRPGDVCRLPLPCRAYYMRTVGQYECIKQQMEALGYGFACPDSDSMIEYIKQIAQAEQAGDHCRKLAGFLLLMSQLRNRWETEVCIAAGASQKTQQAVRLGLAYIREHFHEKCTLKEIAAASGRSPIYFHDVFKEIMNVTPYEYIAELRLEEAKRQLTLTDLDPAIIAEQCGYCSQSYFNFVFKKSTGMTPLHFRRAKAASYLGTDEVSE